MTDLDSACKKAMSKFLEAVKGREPTEEEIKQFDEDTDYCSSWKEGFKEGIS